MSQESMRTLKLFILFIVIKVTKSKKSYCNPQNDFCVVASCQGITTCFQALLCPGVQRLKRMWWKENRHNVSVQCFLRLKKINITSGISGITYCRRGSLLFHTCIYFFNCYDIDTVIWPQLSVTSSPLHCLMLVVWAVQKEEKVQQHSLDFPLSLVLQWSYIKRFIHSICRPSA